MKLDKKSRENWKLAGITLVAAIITGWALDSILILGIMLASGLLFGFLQRKRRTYERNPDAQGVLDGCVLQIISQKEIYGYELVQELRNQGFENMVGGTVYPPSEVRKNSLIFSQNKPSPGGPDRKYFYLTDQERLI